MKLKIYKFNKVTSTNDIAIDLIRKKKKLSGYIYADTQTKGRGYRGRKWISKTGNLFSSLFFSLKENYPGFHEFSIINPIIVSNVIKNFCDIKKINFKFPNDIMINKKKVCGLLQEMITFDDKKFLIIGIGINIISNPNINNKYKATNILYETNNKPKIEEIAKLLVRVYENFFSHINQYNYINFKKKVDLMAIK